MINLVDFNYIKHKIILFSYFPPIELTNSVTFLYRCAGSLECVIVFDIDYLLNIDSPSVARGLQYFPTQES